MKAILFNAVIAVQSAFLLGWAGWHEYVRQTAPVIRLETMPVDPRDLLRGDYMILNYKISRPPEAMTANITVYADVWTVLEARDRHCEIARIATAQPAQLDEGQIAVLARYVGDGRLRFGIEEYFVPEGKGTPRPGKIEIEASVGPDHRLQIKRVLLDGSPYP